MRPISSTLLHRYYWWPSNFCKNFVANWWPRWITSLCQYKANSKIFLRLGRTNSLKLILPAIIHRYYWWPSNSCKNFMANWWPHWIISLCRHKANSKIFLRLGRTNSLKLILPAIIHRYYWWPSNFWKNFVANWWPRWIVFLYQYKWGIMIEANFIYASTSLLLVAI